MSKFRVSVTPLTPVSIEKAEFARTLDILNFEASRFRFLGSLTHAIAEFDDGVSFLASALKGVKSLESQCLEANKLLADLQKAKLRKAMAKAMTKAEQP